MLAKNNHEDGDRFIKYRGTLITERGSDRPWLFETGWFTEFESSDRSVYGGIIVIPEYVHTIVIDAICTFELKYYKNCAKSCNKVNKNHLDITNKGACEHLSSAREEFISRCEDYYLIVNNRAHKYNSANYNTDFSSMYGPI